MNLNVSYKYNSDGIREGKTVTGVIGLRCDNNTYLFKKNLQEDIIGIVDSSNNRVATYDYDAWGRVLSIKDQNGNDISNHNHIGIINPFRYRGYYYDTETGLYYLNSRYYNPEWCSFINADGIIGANEDITSYNLYPYVSNNPVNLSDEIGYGLFGISRFIPQLLDPLGTTRTGMNNTQRTRDLGAIAGNAVSSV